MLKEEKSERLDIKSDPHVQVNVAASCSKCSSIGITHPFLWSAISNHTLVDKCTLVSFNIPCPGTANRTIIGLGCVREKPFYCPGLDGDSFKLPMLLRGANSLAAAASFLTQGPSSPCPTPQPGGGDRHTSPAQVVLPRCALWSHLPAPSATAWLYLPLQPPAPCSLEGRKFLPAAQQPFYCLINVMNCWNRAVETPSKWKIKLLFWANWGKLVMYFTAAVCVEQTVALSDALCE